MRFGACGICTSMFNTGWALLHRADVSGRLLIYICTMIVFARGTVLFRGTSFCKRLSVVEASTRLGLL